MEEVSMVAEGEDRCGANLPRCSVEAQSALAGELARHRGGQPLRPLWIDEAATTKPGNAEFDVSGDGGLGNYIGRSEVVFENISVSEGDGFSKYDKVSDNDGVSQNVQLSEANAVSDFENISEEPATLQNVKVSEYDKMSVDVDASEYNLGVEDLGKDAGGGEKEVRRRPQRGLTQKMKKGVTAGLLAMALVQATGMMRTSYTVMEVFAGKAMMTQVAATREGWMAYEPVDILLGGTEHDMLQKDNAKKLKEVVRTQKPDVVVITPPCGPWSLWQNQRLDFDALEALRKEHLPFWQLTRDLWELQDSEGRWVMTEQPATSEALDLSYMRERSNLHRVVLDQCMFGLKDPISHKAYRKTTALDVNDERWARELAKCRRCDHQPHQHEQVKGSVKFEGTWQRRSTLAGAWTKPWCQHILRAFEKAQATEEEVPMKLHQGFNNKPNFDVNAVEGVVTPEEVLRQQLQATGMEGENFDFIHFEGEARSLPRKVRRMLAHLHVTLGHLSNERLARMLSLAGGGRHVLLGAKHLRCQVCCMVRPPQSRPQASYNKPSNFNEKVAGDCLYRPAFH